MFNAGQANNVGMFNSGQIQNNNQFNAGNQLQAGMFNAGNNMQAGMFNAGNNMAAQQFNNNFGLQSHQANFGNSMAGRNQYINEALMMRQQPTQDLAQLMGAIGGIPTQPVQNYGVMAPDYQGAVGSNYAARSNQYANQMGGLMGLAGAAVGPLLALSDRRLKTDIKKVGQFG